MKKTKSIELLYVIFPLINLLTGLMTRYNIFPITIGVAIRVILLLFLIIYIFFMSKCKYKKPTLIYYLSLFMFCLIYLLTKPNYFNLTILFNECSYLFKFLYYPILFFGLLNLFDEEPQNSKTWHKIIFSNLIFYIIFMLIPIITKSSFNAYVTDATGFSGWFYAANELGPILLMMFPVLFKLLDEHKKLYLLLSTLSIFCILAISTKVSSLGLGLIIFVYFIIYCFQKKKILNKLTILLSLIIFIIFYSAFGKNIYRRLECYNAGISMKECLKENNSPTTNPSTTNPNTDFLSIILSNRNHKVIDINKIYVQSKIPAKLFGVGFYDLEKQEMFVIEMDFLDIFYHYGIVGFILLFMPYLFIFYELIKSIKNKIFHFKPNLIFATFIYVLMIGISFLAGHIIGSPAVSSLLVLYEIYICTILNPKLLSENKRGDNDEI